jgi:hypothetical protein
MPSVNLDRLVFEFQGAISATGGKNSPIGFVIVVKDDTRAPVDEQQGRAMVGKVESHTSVGTVGAHSAEIIIGDTLQAISTDADDKPRRGRGRI